MQIGELATKTNTKVTTVRFYEQIGPASSTGSYRRGSADVPRH